MQKNKSIPPKPQQKKNFPQKKKSIKKKKQ